ncbi:hypothetical protein EG830_06355 [bacterium]|nr:hypothetical protein [bacterium]
MELFLLIKSRPEPGVKLPETLFREFFGSETVTHQEGNYSLYLNRKTLIPSCSHYRNDNASAFATGTFIYKEKGPEESLRFLLEDFSGGCFDAASLLGHYFIFLFLPEGIKVLYDGTGLVKAYHDSPGSYLASSFLLASRLYADARGRLTLNRNAAAENIVTGGITGSETPLNEISSFSSASFGLFPGIDFIIPRTSGLREEPASEAEAIRRETGILENYFRACTKLAGKSGADSGLTGGYDSRLVLACAIKYIEGLQVHSHFRHGPSAEWSIARSIASGEGLTFISPEVTNPREMNEEMLQSVLESSFRFNDGIISLHCNWLEEYNTFEYRQKVLGSKQLGFGGIGGEQYRNQDRLSGKPWLFTQWLKYLYVRKVSGTVFQTDKDELELLERIKVKIFNTLGFGSGKQWINLKDLKRIQNEVLIRAYRGARTDAENRHSWYLSPMADITVSTSAYGITRFLKDSKKFEAAMIRKLSPSLAAYPTDYGYDLVRGEPLYVRTLASAFENLLPASLKWKIRSRARSGGLSEPITCKFGSSKLLERYCNNVESAGLPVSIPGLIRRENTAHMVISLGFLLEKLNISTQ